jgi:predicted alpha/beta-fold hydrolase
MSSLKSTFLTCLTLGLAVTGFAQSVKLTCYPGDPVALTEVRFQSPRANVTIPNTNQVKGYLEHLPDGYNAQDANTKYPLVIVLHVLNEWGNGTEADLCKFFANKWQAFPYIRIENGSWPATLPTGTNENKRFITLTPQFTVGTYSHVPVDAFIEYAKANYNIDASRIYLIGTSQGANVALEYVGSSEANAKKIAGILALSPCSAINATQAQNIKNGNVGVWQSQCENDNLCNSQTASNNYNRLRTAGVDNNKNVLSHLTNSTGCVSGNPHDSWTPTLSPSFTYSTLSSPASVYQWFGTLTAGQILPVTLKSFDVKVVNNQGWLSWETTQEENGEYFYIERAGDNMNFIVADSLFTKNIPNGSKYQWVDGNPSIGNNYYRLVQKDKDGKLQFFEIKKITIQAQKLITIINNPFQHQVKFSIQSTVSDQYQIQVRDIQGKVYHTEKLQAQAGRRDVEVQAGNWPAGMYLLSIQSNGTTETHKLIKR